MEQVHHIRHKAGNWNTIAQNIPGDPEGFRDYLSSKSRDACGRKGDDFVFGETVNNTQAERIRSVSREKGIKEVTGGE